MPDYAVAVVIWTYCYYYLAAVAEEVRCYRYRYNRPRLYCAILLIA